MKSIKWITLILLVTLAAMATVVSAQSNKEQAAPSGGHSRVYNEEIG